MIEVVVLILAVVAMVIAIINGIRDKDDNTAGWS
jgi:hypothetical protein